MAKKIINLVISVITDETESILDTYPDHPYQQAFSIPEMRKRLVSYVLSHVPGIYTVVEDVGNSGVGPNMLYLSEEQRTYIQSLIHRGIQHVLDEHTDWVDQHIPQNASPELTPSSWFG